MSELWVVNLVCFLSQSFYTFCTYVAWIVFRRQHFTEIEDEIGRLFRTSMFNIPRRKRENEESGGEKKCMTFVQFRYDLLTFLNKGHFQKTGSCDLNVTFPSPPNRRMMAKRPAIKKAVNMRSPVMSALLPSLQEKAQNILEKKYHQVGIELPAQMQKQMGSLDSVPMPV